ncbi:MAG: FlxA-like family protein [Beijerinckiaceae bacterium]
MSNEELAEKMLRMEKRMRMLEDQLGERDARLSAAGGKAIARNGKKQRGPAPAPYGEPAADPQTVSLDEALAKRKPILGVLDSPVQGLALGAYGEVKFGKRQNPDAGGQWQNGFDATRLVLLPTFAITDNIIFNAEIEFEHGGSAFDADDKLHGTAEIEQMFVDFKINPYFNWRAPGIDLVPIGYINQHHEPTQFYSVDRPELYQNIIPSTWRAPATGAYGRLAEGLSYQVQVSHSLEDFGDDFSKRTDANTVIPFPGPYAPGIDGKNGLAFARAPLGDFRQLNNTYAFAGRLDFSPAFFPGFAGSVSGYYSPNVTPRSAFGDLGNPLTHTSVAMFDAEFRYRLPNTGLELRGEYVQTSIGDLSMLRANNDTDPTNNVGKRMYGYSAEIAYHFLLGEFIGSSWEAVPFYRYTRENLQAGGFAGTDLNMPTGAGHLQFHTLGVAVFPSPKVVLKVNYQKVISQELGGAHADKLLGAVGFFF